MEITNILLLCLTTHTVWSGFGIRKTVRKNYDKLRKRINEVTGGKKGEEMFLDINDFEYPGSNETKRQIHRERWDEYYKCLKNNYANLGAEKAMLPRAIAVLEGTAVTLECQICISPTIINLDKSTSWYFDPNNFNLVISTPETMEPIETTEHIIISSDDAGLNMYNIRSYQSGSYWCELEGTVDAPYYLHVDNGTEPVQTVHKFEEIAPTVVLPDYNIKIYSTWTSWTVCSTCDVVGKKIRRGYCTISLLESAAHRYIANESIPGLRNQRDVASTSVQQETISQINRILPIFENKLPCRSRYTPNIIQDIPAIKKRKTEIHMRFCKPSCPRNVVFEVRDRSGHVLESANNSAGIYSVLQGLPEAPPSVERITIYRKHDTKTILECPGNLNSNAPVIWKIRDKLLKASTIREVSKGRISIDLRDRIIFEKLRFSDANIYSCWQNGELAGTIRLEVAQEMEIKFDHRVFMIGSVAILGVFVFVFWKAFKGRKRIASKR